MFENRVLRKTSGPKRDEVARDLRRLDNDDLHDPYCSPHIAQIKNNEMVGVRGRYGGEERRGIIHTVFWSQRVRKRDLLVGLEVYGEKIFKLNFNKEDRRGEDVDWIEVLQDTDGWQSLMNLRVP